MDSKIIENFSQKVDKSKVQGFYDIALNIVTQALEKLSQKENSLTNLTSDTTRIFPMGDYTNDTFIDESGELEIVVASHNAQLIIENENFSKSYKIANTKKKKSAISNNGTFDKIVFDYTNVLTTFFEKSTYLVVCSEGIKILCLEEYGFKILIRFATYDENDSNVVLSFWDPINKISKPVNLFLYTENMEKKDKKTGGNYKKIVRIFKNLRK